jgi:hypothetical protein
LLCTQRHVLPTQDLPKQQRVGDASRLPLAFF